MEKQLENIGKKAVRFSVGTLVSRISGMIREIATAAFLGASAEVGAFMIAYRFSMMLRRLLGEGGLLFGFVPEYEALRQTQPQQARQFFADLTYSLTLILLLVIVFFEAFLWGLHHLGQFTDTVPMMMLMIPSLLFIIIGALWGAQLQCLGDFFKVGISPSLINVIWIVSLIFLHKTSQPTLYLSLVITISFFAQVLFLSKKPWKQIKGIRPRLFSPGVRKLFFTLSFTLIGVGAMQVNSFIDMLFARLSSPEGPAYLAYAIRIQQLPLALISISVASALLPALVRAPPVERERLLHNAIEKVLLFVTPCTLALIAIAPAIVNLLYNRGAFGLFAYIQTTKTLVGYAFALLPTALILVLNQRFYAEKNYKKPVIIALAAIGMNIVCNAVFVRQMDLGHESVAWATAIASTLQLVLTLLNIQQRLMRPKIIFKLCISSVCALAVTMLADSWLYQETVMTFVRSKGVIVLPTTLFAKVGHFILLGALLSFTHLLFHFKLMLGHLNVKKYTRTLSSF